MRLFLALLALWLVLNESLAPGTCCSAPRSRSAASRCTRACSSPANRVRNRPGAALRLLGLVVADIVRSNLAVARIVLGLGRAQRSAGFLALPLELRASRRAGGDRLHHHRDPGHQLGALRQRRQRGDDPRARPGRRGRLDPLFKQRYERPLMEIFE